MPNSDINTKKHGTNGTNFNFTSNPVADSLPKNISAAPNFRAEFVSQDEQKKYTTLLNMTDKTVGNSEILYIVIAKAISK